MGLHPSAKLLPPSRLSNRRQQVAAVCYRIRKRGIEFLLVQTRGGRWIFPKGGVEPGLTPAQSAALEAFEEAGVHGRMERISFARYFRSKPDPATTAKGARTVVVRRAQADFAVTAHLCEVSRLEPPQESNRNPTWFSAEKAKQRLLKGRAPEFGAELAGVVDRAAARIRRLHGGSTALPIHTQPGHSKREALHEVHFDAFELARRHGVAWAAAYARYIRREQPGQRSSASPPLGPNRPTLRLQSGTASANGLLRKVRFIDDARPANGAKAPAKSAKGKQE